jgi:two-component system, response regulator / RNA-binding antiterminator
MLRVMLIDDESAARADQLEEALNSNGFTVVAKLTSMSDLTRQVERLQPDVIIIDTESPSRDTLEHIVVMGQSKARPIVMFSADHSSDTIQAAVHAGVSAYMVDGIDISHIKPIINSAIANFNEFQRLKSELAEASTKLEDRKLIERAKGLLMKKKKMSEDEAYHSMRKLAMERNLRLGDVAKQLLAVADLLG